MAKKGCGCLSFMMAIMVGLLFGGVGLGVTGYYWLNNSVLHDDPVKIERAKWNAVDEAAITIKLAPVYLALRQNRESIHNFRIRPKEANRLWDECVMPMLGESIVDISFKDNNIIMEFSHRAGPDKYLNGKLEVEVKGTNGDFEVKVNRLKTGKFVWPEQLLPYVSYWMVGQLERKPHCYGRPVRLLDIKHSKKGLDVRAKVFKEGG
jgi:hypothetical protein